jgi:hypothetical protein
MGDVEEAADLLIDQPRPKRDGGWFPEVTALV